MTDIEAIVQVSLILTLLFVIFWGVPCGLAYAICEAKNRNPWKGLVLALFFGYLAPLGLWLALRRRSRETGQLI